MKFEFDNTERYRVVSSPELRLRGELIVFQSSQRPSVRPCVCACVYTFKHEYLWNQWVDRNQILSEASFGWGKGCIRLWLDQIRNPVSTATESSHRDIMEKTASPLFSAVFHPILFILVGNDDMHESRMSLNFGLLEPLTAELAALERLKKSP